MKRSNWTVCGVGVPVRGGSARLAWALAAVVSLAAPQSAFADVLNAGAASNNGGSPGWAVFFDLQSTTQLAITEMTTASTAAANTSFTVQVYTRSGTALGGPVASGPGSSPTGWTSLGTAAATQGATEISLPIDIPDISVPSGQVIGVALVFTGAGPRYTGTGAPAYSVFNDSNLTLTTGDARSVPFTTTGSWFASRALAGSLTYTVGLPVELQSFGVE